MRNQLFDFVRVGINNRQSDAHFEILRNGQIKNRINRILSPTWPLRSNLSNTFIQVLFVLILLDPHDMHPIPLVGKDRPADLQILAESLAELRVSVQRNLLGDWPIKGFFPRRQAGKDKRDFQRVILLNRPGSDLRRNPQALCQERLNTI